MPVVRMHQDHKNNLHSYLVALPDDTTNLELQLKNAHFSTELSPLITNDKGDLSTETMEIRQFGRQQNDDDEPSLPLPLFADSQMPHAGKSEYGGGGLGGDVPFDDWFKPGRGKPFAALSDYMIDFVPLLDDNEAEIPEQNRDFFSALGKTDNTFAIVVTMGGQRWRLELDEEQWQQLWNLKLLGAPDFLFRMVTALGTGNQRVQQRFRELAEFIKEQHHEAIWLWTEDILNTPPEQVRVDVWLDLQWQHLLTKMLVAAIRETPDGNGSEKKKDTGSGSSKDKSSEGENTHGSSTVNEGSANKGSVNKGSESADKAPSGQGHGGGEEPPGQPGATEPAASVGESQEQILEQLLRTLKSSANTDEEIIKLNLDRLLKQLSPNFINHFVEGATLLYHLVDLLDLNKRALLIELVETLLDKYQASPMLPVTDGRMIVHRAAQRGLSEVVGALLQKEENAALYTDGEGRMPLHYACEEGHIETVQLLLNAAPKAHNHPDNQKNTPLFLAISRGKTEVVKKLVDQQPLRPADQPIVLQGILKCLESNPNNEEILVVLIESGFDVNTTDSQLNTLAHHSAWRANLKILEVLIEHKANPFIENNINMIPLERIITKNARTRASESEPSQGEQKVQAVLMAQLSPEELEILIGRALDNGNISRLESLREAGIQPTKPENQNRYLHLAISNHHFGTALQLIRQGVNPDSPITINGREEKPVKILLDNVHSQFKNLTEDRAKHSETFHKFWSPQRTELCKLVIQVLIKTDYIDDKKWQSFIDTLEKIERADQFIVLQVKTHKTAVSELLKVHKIAKQLNRILEVKRNSPEVVLTLKPIDFTIGTDHLDILLKKGVDINTVSVNGSSRNSLVEAINDHKFRAVKWLIEHGADVDSKVGPFMAKKRPVNILFDQLQQKLILKAMKINFYHVAIWQDERVALVSVVPEILHKSHFTRERRWTDLIFLIEELAQGSWFNKPNDPLGIPTIPISWFLREAELAPNMRKALEHASEEKKNDSPPESVDQEPFEIIEEPSETIKPQQPEIRETSL